MSVPKGTDAVLDELEIYCEKDYKKYRRFLLKLKALVDECCEGHGIGEN